MSRTHHRGNQAEKSGSQWYNLALPTRLTLPCCPRYPPPAQIQKQQGEQDTLLVRGSVKKPKQILLTIKNKQARYHGLTSYTPGVPILLAAVSQEEERYLSLHCIASSILHQPVVLCSPGMQAKRSRTMPCGCSGTNTILSGVGHSIKLAQITQPLLFACSQTA